MERAVESFKEEPRDADKDIAEEEEKAIEGKDSAIRVVNLKKTFKKMQCCKKPKVVNAVQGISFTVETGELFCLLGHNG